MARRVFPATFWERAAGNSRVSNCRRSLPFRQSFVQIIPGQLEFLGSASNSLQIDLRALNPSVQVSAQRQFKSETMIEESSSNVGNSRTQPLLTKEHGSRKFCEVAGGVTADCAAVACCPCALLNLAVLAFVKLPAGLCKKAWRRIRRKRRKKSKAAQGKDVVNEDPDVEDSSGNSSQDELLTPRYSTNAMATEKTRVSTEKVWEEVTGKSYVGFWRNLSNRDHREQTP